MPATGWIWKFEWPEEIWCLEHLSFKKKQLDAKALLTYLLEIRTGCGDLVDEVLNTKYVIFAKSGFDDTIAGEGDALLVHLSISTFVD